MDLIFEFGDFVILFVNCLLIGPFHLSNKFNSEHVLVKSWNHFELKNLKLPLFLFHQLF